MVKEKWSTDPNGEVWARDSSKFGQRMLEKMGWKEGKGLGANESGGTSHVKTSKRAPNLGLGAESSTPDRWTEHITDFDDILSKLNAAPVSCSAPVSPLRGSAPASALSVAQSEGEEEKPKRKRRKKAKDLYTKFKKHKNLTSLSSQDLLHIFGEPQQDKQCSQNISNPLSETSVEENVESLSGVQTITSTMSCTDYFKSKKVKLSSNSLDNA